MSDTVKYLSILRHYCKVCGEIEEGLGGKVYLNEAIQHLLTSQSRDLKLLKDFLGLFRSILQ